MGSVIAQSDGLDSLCLTPTAAHTPTTLERATNEGATSSNTPEVVFYHSVAVFGLRARLQLRKGQNSQEGHQEGIKMTRKRTF